MEKEGSAMSNVICFRKTPIEESVLDTKTGIQVTKDLKTGSIVTKTVNNLLSQAIFDDAMNERNGWFIGLWDDEENQLKFTP